MAFKSVGSSLSTGPLSESHPDFEILAKAKEAQAVKRAAKAPMSEAQTTEAMEKLSGQVEVKATYKIEIVYLEARNGNKPSPCAVTVWESGKRFHGGGDQSMFWCINAKNQAEGCGGLIPDDHVKNGLALCPHCKKMVNQNMLPVERVGIFTATNLAKEIARIYRHLGSNCDVYLKFHKTDADGMTRLRADKKTYKEAAIYPLKNIMRDTLGGADLTKRFEAFLLA